MRTPGDVANRRKRRAGEESADRLSASLLAAKLIVPRPPGRLVQRQRLFDLLDGGIQGPVTLVSAQAGAGKTVLLASWAASGHASNPIAWLSLDAGDNEPARFWACVRRALRRSEALAERSRPRSPLPEQPGPEAAHVTPLLHELATLHGPVVLVLDDFHAIVEPEILNGMELLLRRGPPQLRLVIATRADPTLPLLPRLRVNGELVEVRAADLAFSTREATELLAGHDVTLPEADLASLQARTEGWAAGLRLAALSLQGRPDPSPAVAAFAGTDRTVTDYLVAEVLDRLPREERDFLLRTCIVDRISGELADALTEATDGELKLARLERANTFIIALGAGRLWYRYQNLFAEVLRYELRRKMPEEVPRLHHRAARWYAAHGLPIDAARHAVEAGEWHGGVELVADHGLQLALDEKAATVRELVDRLPNDVIRGNPEISALLAFGQIDLLSYDEAAANFEFVQKQHDLVPEGRRDRFALLLALLKLVIARQSGRLDRVVAAGREIMALQARTGALVVASAQDKDLRVVALLHLGVAEQWSGYLDAAQAHLEDAKVMAEQTGLGHAQLQSMSHLALLHVIHGRLRDAFETGRAAVDLAEQRGRSGCHQLAGAHLALALVCLEWNDLAAAARHMDRALGAGAATPWRPLRLATAIAHASLRHAQGDSSAGVAILDAARAQANGWSQPLWISRWLDVTDAQLRTATGDVDGARLVLDHLRDDGLHGARWSAPAAVALAHLQLIDGDPAGAADTLAPYLVDGQAGLPGPTITAWLLDALAARLLGDNRRVSRSLEHALSLAVPEGFRQRFAAAPVRDLLGAHLGQATSFRSFVGSLLDTSAPRARGRVPVELVEPLTDRERVVLRYLPSRLSAVEIADELYLSVHTVKTHLRHVYRKLEATSRAEAVDRARELQLI